jgi:uncharacterized protein (UPF0332 family)
MSFDWSQYLDQAQDLFTQALNCPYTEANMRSSISRAYYAAFHKTRLHLHSKWGVSFPNDASAHEQARKELQKRYKSAKQQNKIANKVATTLNRMRIVRNKADYSDFVTNLSMTAQENLIRSKDLISDLKKL